jgi:hypothetical protein
MKQLSPRTDRATRGSGPLTRTHVIAFVVSVILVPVVGGALGQLPYDDEYPVIEYSTRQPSDAIARLQREIDNGEVQLEFDAENGYLVSLLRELDIDLSSQMLVFSKTSFQVNLISPETPRALYFNDDVYVGWLQGTDVMEFSAMDPDLGIVFYTLDQTEAQANAQAGDATPRFQRQTAQCLRCHDTYSLSGGGVPRHLVGSGFTDQYGGFASHEGWHLTTYQSPIEERWGGWYVTGTHGDQRHMGNIIVDNVADPAEFDLNRGANATDLSEWVDTEPYLGEGSDIVALMVLEHQASVQSVIVRVNYETRKALRNEIEQNIRLGRERDFMSAETGELIQDWAEPLVGALLMVGEAPLGGPIAGTSGFAEQFSSRGPADSRGRSLRGLELNDRLFQYPLSYVIYSDAFDALPIMVKEYVYRRIGEVLRGEDENEAFSHLSGADRRAILEIVQETKTDFAQSLIE